MPRSPISFRISLWNTQEPPLITLSFSDIGSQEFLILGNNCCSRPQLVKTQDLQGALKKSQVVSGNSWEAAVYAEVDASRNVGIDAALKGLAGRLLGYAWLDRDECGTPRA